MAVIIIQGEREKELRIHYEVDTTLAPIGAGGMGQVLRGVMVDESTGVRRAVAIKFLFEDLPQSAIERTRREASVQIHNENLVEMFGFVEVETTDSSGNTKTRYHVASELLNGVMLHDLLRGRVTNADGEELPFAQELYRQYQNDRLRFAVFIIRNLLSGIMALHDAGFIHRDIDPSNVMITAEGKVKLIDFGICKNLNELDGEDRHLTSAGQFMGKAAYASPELVTGDVQHQDATTDLYAVGIMFYELLAGKLPFEGPTHEVLEKQLKSPVPVKNLADKYARKIVQKATAKKQADRYASAAEFRVAVEQLSRNSVSAGSNPGIPMGTNPGISGGTNPGTNPGLTGSGTPALVKPAGTTLLPKLIDMARKKPAIPIAAAVAVVLLVVVASIISGNNKAEQKAAEEAELARQSAIDRRRAELQDAIADSKVPTTETDSLTGIEVPTAGYLTRNARAMLANPQSAAEGVATLEKVASKGYKSSAEAIALLAALKGRSATLDSEIAAATDALYERDYSEAHRLNKQAVALDPSCYSALYELGCDYLAGNSRGVVERDLAQAKEYLQKSLSYAQAAGDSTFVVLCTDRLSSFE